jgi:CheY-like chemotaxis protein
VLNPHTILLVEDDELLGRMIAEFLRGEGYHVRTARNGLDGYLSYYHDQTGTVVTDIEMPELDGFEMMDCIRDINPSVNTIYMSGAAERYRETLAAEAVKFGAAVLRKPFASSDLLKLIICSSVEPPRARSSSRHEGLWAVRRSSLETGSEMREKTLIAVDYSSSNH